MKYLETIADNLSKAGWSWGCVATMDREVVLAGGELFGSPVIFLLPVTALQARDCELLESND